MAKVLIIDDSHFLAEKIKNFLTADGHEVVAKGEDGDEGVGLFKRFSPELITLDITMPNKDGCDCLREILMINPEARVIMITAIDDQSIIVDCMNNGAKGFIEKPLKFRDREFCDDFRDTIQAALS